MIAAGYPYMFRILGPLDGSRKRVDADAAQAAYRHCDPRARVDQEAYLSHFRFDESFREHLATTGSTRNFSGATYADLIAFDIDREGDLGQALQDTRQLVGTLVKEYLVPPSGVLVSFSGNKGFHVEIPTRLWLGSGGPLFHRIARVFALLVADTAGIAIDAGVYDCVRALRAPNSRHPKTGLHKRHVPIEEVDLLSVAALLDRAREPAPFDVPDCNVMPIVDGLAAQWMVAEATVKEEVAAAKQRRAELAAGAAKPRLNRLTLEIIRGEPVAVGDRHRLIYSAARDLAASGAPRHLIDSLLREAALDTGLPPREVDRQIDCGFSDAAEPIRDVPAAVSSRPEAEPVSWFECEDDEAGA
jgi:hypothetical protein